MVTTELANGGYPPEIIGYAEPWIVAPGDAVAIKVRSISYYDIFATLVANIEPAHPHIR